MPEPKVIVLILSYNGKALLDDSVSSYLMNDYSNFDVVVIDNGSADGTLEYVNIKWPEVYVLRTEKNLGYSGGFNFGLEYAFRQKNADYVLITNNDVRADSKVISELVSVAETDKMIGFVTGKVYYYDKPDTLQTVGFKEDKIKWVGGHIGNKEVDKGQYNEVAERFFTDDIFMLVKRELYKSVGGYDTEFQFQAEQFDWQIRAKAEGYKIFYAPGAIIWHKESMTIGKTSAFKEYYNVRNSLVVRLKHRDKDYIRVYFRWHFKNYFLIPFLRSTAKFQLAHAKSIVFGFLSAVIWGLKHRKLVLF